MPRLKIVDAQAAMGFMINQASYIEAEVYRTQYPDIIYPQLVPIDESAPDWIKSITYFSIDSTGKAEWFHHEATDMRLADVNRSKFEVSVEMAAIGYRYTLEEIGQAMQLGFALTAERGIAAGRAYDEFCESVAFIGDARKNYTGLINNALVSSTTVPVGVSTTTPWSTKTGDEIIKDINLGLTGIYTTSKTVEMADTVLLPVDQFNLIATTRLSSQVTMSVLEWIQRYNVYTQQTGRPITIRAVRQLKDGGGAGVDRMVIYRRDPGVVKMHIPMRHRFLPVWQTGPMIFDVPGIFRLGGVEVRRPVAVRYLNGI